MIDTRYNLTHTERNAVAALLYDLGDAHERAALDTAKRLSERVMSKLSADDLHALADRIKHAAIVRVYDR